MDEKTHKYDALIAQARELYPEDGEENCLVLCTDGTHCGCHAVGDAGEDSKLALALATVMRSHKPLADVLIAAAGTVLAERVESTARQKEALKKAYKHKS